MINQLLQAELQGGVHALSIVVSDGYYLLINPSLLCECALFKMSYKKIYIIIMLFSRRKHQNSGKQAIKRWLRVLLARAVLESSIVYDLTIDIINGNNLRCENNLYSISIA